MKAHQFFGLLENCFAPSPNPRYLFLTDQISACLFKCRFVIEERQGLSAIIGKVGFGKTSVVRCLVDGYIDNPDYRIVLLPNGNFPSEMQLAKTISDELGISKRRSMLGQLHEIRDFAIETYHKGGNVVIFIDEAQALRGSQFDFLRELLNFETNESKVIQIVIAGQPEIEMKLATKSALVSRIILTSYLDTFTLEDMVKAIEHRVRVAGGQLDQVMNEKALHSLYIASRGIPREIVKIANAAMLLAAINEIRPISAELVELAVDNILQSEESLHVGPTEETTELRRSAAD
ncbi:MAG TPA: AAA family ATPase [Acidobacteriota bacterium]|nr:AAA family ATPase [Acidobacteriota bacterium]